MVSPLISLWRFISSVNSGVGLLLVRIAAGVTTGTLAILSAQPTDVVKIRMQADVRAPGEAARYRGVVHAYKDIAVKEGMAGLYKGECCRSRTMHSHSTLSMFYVGQAMWDDIKILGCPMGHLISIF